jgi:ABC-2 type transport system ATP-binding protein
VIKMPALELRDVSKSYPHNDFILKVDHLSIEQGSIFGLLGPNGSGKTTLLKLLMGLVHPDQGNIRLLGQDVKDASLLIENTAYMPENKNLYENMTVAQMLGFARDSLLGWDNDKAQYLNDLFPLNPKKRISTLSYGERTLLYARLIFPKSATLLILDEPTRGLDPLMQNRMLTLIKEESIAGKTVLFSSHQLVEVEETADAVALVKNGSIVLQGNLDDLKADLFLLTLPPGMEGSVAQWPIKVLSAKKQTDRLQLLCSGDPNSRQLLREQSEHFLLSRADLRDIFLHLVENGGEHR